jgi:Sec-independent protein secretion pathway component TatC
MARKFNNRAYALLAAVILAIGVFGVDLLTPAPVVVASLYMLPMLALVWWRKKRGLYLGAVLCSGLVFLAYILSPAEYKLPFSAINRLLPVFILFVFAVAIGRRVDSRRELRRQFGRVKRLLDERNSALEVVMLQQRQTEEEKAQLLERLAQVEGVDRPTVWSGPQSAARTETP